MLKNVLAVLGVVMLAGFVVLASPALGKPHRVYRAAITDRHALSYNVWHPDTRSIA